METSIDPAIIEARRIKKRDNERRWRQKNPKGEAERKRRYRLKYPDKTRAISAKRMREWREKQGDTEREKAAARMKAWREANAVHFHAYRAGHYQKNADLIKAAVKKWRTDNRDRYLKLHALWDGTRRAAEGKTTMAEYEVIWIKQSGLCVYCGADLEVSCEIDHIQPISRGGSNWPDNIQLVCFRCNRRKHTKTDAEFRALT